MDLPSEIYANVLIYCTPRDFYALSRVSWNTALGARSVRNEYKQNYMHIDSYNSEINLMDIIFEYHIIAYGKYSLHKTHKINIDNHDYLCDNNQCVKIPMPLYKELIYINTSVICSKYDWWCTKCGVYPLYKALVLLERIKNTEKVHFTVCDNIVCSGARGDGCIMVVHNMFTTLNGNKHGFCYKYDSMVDPCKLRHYSHVSINNFKNRIHRNRLIRVEYYHKGTRLFTIGKNWISLWNAITASAMPVAFGLIQLTIIYYTKKVCIF